MDPHVLLPLIDNLRIDRLSSLRFHRHAADPFLKPFGIHSSWPIASSHARRSYRRASPAMIPPIDHQHVPSIGPKPIFLPSAHSRSFMDYLSPGAIVVSGDNF